jgi:hypothetical protein
MVDRQLVNEGRTRLDCPKSERPGMAGFLPFHRVKELEC